MCGGGVGKCSFGFFLGFLGSFWEGASSFGGRRARGERARGGFRTRPGGLGRTPRVHAGLAHVSTIPRSRSRLSSRVTRREERGLVRGLAKNPPFPRGLFLLPAEGWVARGLEGDAADRTAAGIPRDEGRKDRGGEVRGGGDEVRLGRGASACPQRLRRLVVVARRFFEVRSWRPTSGRGDFERNRRRPAGRDRPAERRGPTRERTPGNFPDTSKLASFLAPQPARRVFGPVSAARVEPTRRGERRVAMAARDGHDAPDSA